MAEGYAWHELPAREAAKVPVKRAVRHRTRSDNAERQRLYSLPKQHRWTEDRFLHRQMRKSWRGARVANQIVAAAGSFTTQVWHGRGWVYPRSLEYGQRTAIPLKGTPLPSGSLRILLQDNSQVEVHHAVAEEQVCSTRPCGPATMGVDKGYTEACTDSDGKRHRWLGWTRYDPEQLMFDRTWLCH